MTMNPFSLKESTGVYFWQEFNAFNELHYIQMHCHKFYCITLQFPALLYTTMHWPALYCSDLNCKAMSFILVIAFNYHKLPGSQKGAPVIQKSLIEFIVHFSRVTLVVSFVITHTLLVFLKLLERNRGK